jgi:hypothetical protein
MAEENSGKKTIKKRKYKNIRTRSFSCRFLRSAQERQDEGHEQYGMHVIVVQRVLVANSCAVQAAAGDD